MNARNALPLTLALGSISALGVSLPPRTASAETPPLSALPLAQFPASLRYAGAPATIPATEHVEGIYPAHEPATDRAQNLQRGGYLTVSVFTTEEAARDYRAGRGRSTPATRRPDLCFAESGAGLAPMTRLYLPVPRTAPSPPPAGFPGGQTGRAAPVIRPHVPPSPDPMQSPVKPVRLERMVKSPQGVTFEFTDAWVDGETLGARVISRSSVSFAEVAKGPSGIVVYGARDARDAREVSFVVLGPTTDDKGSALSAVSQTQQLSAQIGDRRFDSSSCGRLRVSLATGQGRGQMATVFTTAILTAKVNDDEDEPDRSRGDESDAENESETQRRRAASRPPSIRLRPVTASLSVSQLSGDREPVLSVSFGWAGKDRRAAF